MQSSVESIAHLKHLQRRFNFLDHRETEIVRQNPATMRRSIVFVLSCLVGSLRYVLRRPKYLIHSQRNYSSEPILNLIFKKKLKKNCRSRWPRGLRRRLRPFGLDSSGGHGCLSVVSVVCCEVEVYATGRKVKWSPTECGVIS